ncbi:MAG TPA: TetR/AcrR family transcriptional regulator [Halobacteriales archaeon]|nr:TetR/AcrR family transcriptional regulator [Halobacteriales archaeon]
MRGFSEEERARIRRGLLETGREQFARYGPKKTTIADLTDPVGIANSTFYRFFDSKEALYAEILQSLDEELAETVLSESLEATDDPREAIRRFLTAITERIEGDPLLRRVIVDDAYDDLAALQSPEERDAEREEELAYLVPYVERWQEAGLVRDADPRVFANVLRAAVYVTLHREEIGEELYDETIDLYFDALADGLTETE